MKLSLYILFFPFIVVAIDSWKDLLSRVENAALLHNTKKGFIF